MNATQSKDTCAKHPTCSNNEGGAVFDAGMVDVKGAVTVDLVARMTFQFFSVRTKIDALAIIIRKISGAERTRLGIRLLAIFETLLIGKARIALAELDAGIIRVHLFTFADRYRAYPGGKRRIV